MNRHPIVQHLSSCIGACVVTLASAWIFLASTASVPAGGYDALAASHVPDARQAVLESRFGSGCWREPVFVRGAQGPGTDVCTRA